MTTSSVFSQNLNLSLPNVFEYVKMNNLPYVGRFLFSTFSIVNNFDF